MKHIFTFLLFCFYTAFFVIMQGCINDDGEKQAQIIRNITVVDTFELLPLIHTDNVYDIEFYTASVSAIVEEDRGEFITRKGFCWTNEERSPDLDDQFVELGNGAQSFSYTFDSLTAGKTYYLRAFAENSFGVGYGNTLVFETQADTLVDIDGNKYELVKIGENIWMSNNLRVNRYRNGDTIPQINSASTWLTSTTGLTAFNDKKPEYKEAFGQYYNWFAVIDDRNICPSGYHIPIREEIEDLIEQAGGYSLSGFVLKDVDSTLWVENTYFSNNQLGFSAKPAGVKTSISLPNSIYGYQNEGIDANFWYFDSNNIINMGLMQIRSQSGMNLTSTNENYGISVRCIKDK